MSQHHLDKSASVNHYSLELAKTCSVIAEECNDMLALVHFGDKEFLIGFNRFLLRQKRYTNRIQMYSGCTFRSAQSFTPRNQRYMLKSINLKYFQKQVYLL